MTRTISLSVLLPLLSLLLFNGQARSQSPPAPPVGDEPPKCGLAALPSDIQTPIKRDFASWRIQEAQLLSEYARKTWASKNPQACPGIMVGLFQNSVTPSYAVLLVSPDHPDSGYKLIVYNRPEGKPLYEAAEIEHSDDPGASNYFIRKVVLADVFNDEAKKKYNAQSPEGILLINSAEQKREAAVYFLSNNAWRHEPVDD